MLLLKLKTFVSKSWYFMPAVLCGSFIWLVLCPVATAAVERYEIWLAAMPMAAADIASMTGQGQLTATLDGLELLISGSVTGLESPATRAELRQAVPGIRGPRILEVEIPHSSDPTLSSSVRLSRSQTESLRGGLLYLQISTQGKPDGQLRGWLVPVHSLSHVVQH